MYYKGRKKAEMSEGGMPWTVMLSATEFEREGMVVCGIMGVSELFNVH